MTADDSERFAEEMREWAELCVVDAVRIRNSPKPEASPRSFKTNYKLDTVLKEHLNGQKFSSLPK